MIDLKGNEVTSKKLNGNRNQCPTCNQYFNSNGAFDKHRTGRHGVDRRCMTVDEMIAEGMILGEDGFWRGSSMPEGAYQKND